jgi:hypothetical protein
MSVKEPQDRTKDKKKYDSGQGGFVAVLHSLEKQFYGPESPFDAKAKVMLYIRHRALRDFQKTKQIPKSEIMEATGLKPTALKNALRDLEKKKYLLVTRTMKGKNWSDNTYELHPDRYGKDYIYRPEKPSFKVIYGSKGHKSNKKPPSKDIPTGGDSYPHSSDVGQNNDLGVGQNNDLGVGQNNDLGSGVTGTKSLRNSRSKNPYQEPDERTLSEEDENNDDRNNSEDEKAKMEAMEARATIHKIVGGGFKSMPR